MLIEDTSSATLIRLIGTSFPQEPGLPKPSPIARVTFPAAILVVEELDVVVCSIVVVLVLTGSVDVLVLTASLVVLVLTGSVVVLVDS